MVLCKSNQKYKGRQGGFSKFITILKKRETSTPVSKNHRVKDKLWKSTYKLQIKSKRNVHQEECWGQGDTFMFTQKYYITIFLTLVKVLCVLRASTFKTEGEPCLLVYQRAPICTFILLWTSSSYLTSFLLSAKHV